MTESLCHLELGSALDKVVFACFGADTRDMYAAVIDDVFPD